MLTLRTQDVLKSISWSFDEYILPDVTDPFARSLALTISNLLRHVTLRVEREGPLLFQDNTDLRDLLGIIRDAIDGAPPGSPLASLNESSQDIKTSLSKTDGPPGEYRSVDHLIEEALALRWTLTRVIKALNAIEKEAVGDPSYQRVREEIRGYLSRQLGREAQYIHEAFTGPRR